MKEKDLREMVSQMTLEEKAGLCSGADFWHTKSVERLGIPSVMLSDGPHGLRKQEKEGDHLGLGDSISAVCFPAGCLNGASFDTELMRLLGETLGRECQAEDIAVLLGPAMNIKRSPLCGRNFEYYSEDSCVSSELAVAYIEGVQSQNVGCSPKHFLANNQEYCRMTSDSVIEERALREIYLASFEDAVKKAKPWTIMGAYNRVNGTFATENERYLQDVLRKEWGFDGIVVSDWGAVNERVDGLRAGMELEMPGTNGCYDKKIVEAVSQGTLEESVLDQACLRILSMVYRYLENRNTEAGFDREKDHEIARKVAEESIILLKNDGVLPLKRDQKVAYIGQYAQNPRYQGGGSSHIHSSKVVSALEAAKCYEVIFAQGYSDDHGRMNAELLKEAVCVAKEADVAVIFAGLPESYESEGFDRRHMMLPEWQNNLIDAVCAVQRQVVVVLHNGAPVEMPWIDRVQGVLECYLAGQAVGEAQVRILYGEVCPSGRLAETFPLRLSDNPTWPWYGREGEIVPYREGILVGYRYYDAMEREVLYPFGHGLSYTEFFYLDLRLDRATMQETDRLTVCVTLENTGEMGGKEVVQLYVAPLSPKRMRPVQELRAFDKVFLLPGEKKTVTFLLDRRAFAYWDTEGGCWAVDNGDYEIRIGKSSRDIVLRKTVHVEQTVPVQRTYTKNSTFADVLEKEENRKLLADVIEMLPTGKERFQSLLDDSIKAADNVEMMRSVVRYSPLRSLLTRGLAEEKLYALLDAMNGKSTCDGGAK